MQLVMALLLSHRDKSFRTDLRMEIIPIKIPLLIKTTVNYRFVQCKGFSIIHLTFQN